MEGINWLNSNSGAVIALATVVLVGITAFYAWVTKKILEENRLMRLNAQKPIIAIYLRSETDGHTSVYLCMENIGAGPAYGVKFATDLSFRLDVTRSLGGEVRLLERGIHYLPPEKKREFRLSHGSYPEHNELMQRQIEITTAYKDSMDEKYEEPFCLDFREHSGK